jgi:hypothetical protein
LDNVFYRRYGLYYKPFARIVADGKLDIAGYPLPNVKQLPRFSTSSRLVRRVMGLAARHGAAPEQRGPKDFNEDGLDLYIDRADPDERARQRETISFLGNVNSLILNAMRTTLAERQIPLAVVTAPTKCEYGACWPGDLHRGRARDLLKTGAESSGIPLIDTVERLSLADFWTEDAHWRPSGHARMAEALSEWIERNWMRAIPRTSPSP